MKRALGIASVIYIILILGIAITPLEEISPSGVFRRSIAILSVTLYFAFVASGILLLPSIKRMPKQSTLLLVALLAATALSEISVRYLHPHGSLLSFRFIHSRYYHHTHPPSTTMVMGSPPSEGLDRGESKAVLTSTNSIGLRSLYTREVFSSKKERIIVLGDSFVYGYLVDQSKIFPQSMERHLRKLTGNPDIAVLNAGMVSYSPLVEGLLFERELAAWQPDVVVLVLDVTDIGDDLLYEESLVHDEFEGFYFKKQGMMRVWPSYPSITDNSALWQRLFYPLLLTKGVLFNPFVMSTRSLIADPIRITVSGEQIIENRFFIYRHPPEVTRRYFMNTLKNISRIAKLANGVGAEFLFVVSPRYHHWSKRESPDNWELSMYSLADPYQGEYLRFFESVRDDIDYPMLNLLPAFESAQTYPLVFRSDPHWNEKGHKLVAETVASELISRGLVKRPRDLATVNP